MVFMTAGTVTDGGSGTTARMETAAMALIALISQSAETAQELEAALRGRGHTVRRFEDARAASEQSAGQPAVFVVDLDGRTREAINEIRRLSEDPATALTPVLAAGTPRVRPALADACAFGAAGFLSRPFISVETVPDTESVLFSAAR